jgi:hypothetical protein
LIFAGFEKNFPSRDLIRPKKARQLVEAEFQAAQAILRRQSDFRQKFWRNKNEKTFRSNLFITTHNLFRRNQPAGAGHER